MESSHAVIRRFTSDTCTLELKASHSPLSRWSKKPLLKDLLFRLRFENSQTPEEQHFSIRGDHDRLEQLQEVVSKYVQDFLKADPETLTLAAQPSSLSSAVSSEKFQPQGETIAFPELPPETEESEENLNNTVDLSQNPLGNPLAQLPLIHLQRKGILKHELFLGSLANDKSGSSLILTTLELQDLAKVLDDYSSQVDTLPNLAEATGTTSPVLWAGTAAGVLVAVGITAYAIQMSNPSTDTNVATVNEELALDNNLANDQPLINVTPFPVPSPGATVPSPTLPEGELPEVSEALPSLSPSPETETPTASQPSASPANPPSLIPQPPIARIPNATVRTLPSQPGSILSEPRQPTSPPPSSSRQLTPNLTPAPRTTIPSPPPSPPPSSPQFSTSTSGVRIPQTLPSPIPNSILTQPRPAQPPSVPSLPPLEARSPLSQTAPSIPPSIPPLPESIVNPSQPPQTPPSATSESPAETAIVNVPQVSEVKNYFQERWQPPESLDEPLEYILYLNSEGALERIIPVGQTAGTYIDRTKMPLLGEPFVSPVQGAGNPQIRLVLSPDGDVETLLE